MHFEVTILFLSLLLSHLIADFHWQPYTWVQDRNRYHFRSRKLRWHCAIHTIVGFMVLASWTHYVGWQEYIYAAWLALIIGLSHFVIDVAKSYSSGNTLAFLLDQAAHIMVLMWVSVLMLDISLAALLLKPQSPLAEILVVVIGYALVVNPCSVFISITLEKWPWLRPPSDSLPKAGHYIGVLERILILTFVLLGEFTAVGFVLAAKSIFRFGDLTASKEKQLTEYVMLGTLLSVVTTVLIGIAVRQLIA
ncbi:DUF3307 domain-containing protein [Pseudoalteromonas fenneropenaei]|uniref:DUF3307 domain-containing protein n=1 Tax=Pseudoalteromonas fenneropenaei TaxID=1737459 RepID=A0ABV7CQ63_9GAMM